jgi:hypothetical protein
MVLFVVLIPDVLSSRVFRVTYTGSSSKRVQLHGSREQERRCYDQVQVLYLVPGTSTRNSDIMIRLPVQWVEYKYLVQRRELELVRTRTLAQGVQY